MIRTPIRRRYSYGAPSRGRRAEGKLTKTGNFDNFLGNNLLLAV